MFQFGLIKGFSVGLEYDDHEVFGFVVNCDVGIFRFTWFKDITEE